MGRQSPGGIKKHLLMLMQGRLVLYAPAKGMFFKAWLCGAAVPPRRAETPKAMCSLLLSCPCFSRQHGISKTASGTSFLEEKPELVGEPGSAVELLQGPCIAPRLGIPWAQPLARIPGPRRRQHPQPSHPPPASARISPSLPGRAQAQRWAERGFGRKQVIKHSAKFHSVLQV